MADANTNGGNKSTIWIVVAVIGLLLAGVFFFQSQNAKSENAELQESLDAATSELNEANEMISEGKKVAKEVGKTIESEYSKYLKEKEAVTQLAGEAKVYLDDLNAQNASLDRALYCEQLLQVGPKNDETWYTAEQSENFQQNIVKYYRDIERDLNQAVKDADNEEEVEALEQALEIAQPYYDNFMTECGDIYNTETGVVDPSLAQ